MDVLNLGAKYLMYFSLSVKYFVYAFYDMKTNIVFTIDLAFLMQFVHSGPIKVY